MESVKGETFRCYTKKIHKWYRGTYSTTKKWIPILDNQNYVNTVEKRYVFYIQYGTL